MVSMMDKDFTHIILYGVLFKLADDFYDEEIYNTWFPMGKIIIYPLLILYTIYLFYFKSKDSLIYPFLFAQQIWYTIILSSKYFKKMEMIQLLGEMELTLDDPFTQLSLIQLPGFIYNFNYVFKTHLVTLSWLIIGNLFVGTFQDIDNSIFGTYILQNRFNKPKSKKIKKIIYRSIFILILLVLLFLFKNTISLNYQPYLR